MVLSIQAQCAVIFGFEDKQRQAEVLRAVLRRIKTPAELVTLCGYRPHLGPEPAPELDEELRAIASKLDGQLTPEHWRQLLGRVPQNSPLYRLAVQKSFG